MDRVRLKLGHCARACLPTPPREPRRRSRSHRQGHPARGWNAREDPPRNEPVTLTV